MRFRHLLPFLALLFLVTACASDDDKNADKPVEELYAEATKALDEGNFVQSTKLFEEVERLYPYSQHATQSQLMAAFSQYRDARYDEAVLSLDRFIELHPGSEDVDYAYYLKALCYYEQISDVSRDQSMTEDALEALTALINRFPDSEYSRDARLKRDLTLDHLAGKEMDIGRYYLKQNDLNAAINRFLVVVRNYQTTTHTPEALHRLVEAYMTLGLKDEATRVAAVLGHNYPGSEWYKASYDLLDPKQKDSLKDNRSWLNRTVDSLL